MSKNLPQPCLTKSSKLQLLPLAEATEMHICGGKATGLARAIELGITVPDGFVVTNQAFESFLKQENLGDRINSLLTSLSKRDIAQLKAAAQTISTWVAATRLPGCVIDTLEDILESHLKDQLLIVRSSAIGEDSWETSFAGQLDSFLNICTIEELESALKQCWASYWGERSLPFQFSAGSYLQGMGVLIQRQIDSNLAGVLFTQAPIKQDNKNDQCMLGEFCYGQGISMVSGQVNPGRFQIQKGDFSWEKLADPEQPEFPGSPRYLKSDWIESLADAALKLEAFHQWPQDIEWSLDQSGELFIVQSRPIVQHANTAATSHMITWSNANVRENFPDPISPLLYSVAAAGYRNYFRNLGLDFGISRQRITEMDGPLRNIIGVHGARIYYNLSSIHSVIRMAPFGDWLINYFNSFVGATETPPPSLGDQQFQDLNRPRILQLLESARITIKTSWQFLFIRRRVAKFEAEIDHFAAKTGLAVLQSKDLIQLRDLLREFMDIRLNRWTDASLADVASMICYGILNSLLRNTFPGDNQIALTNSLLKGITGLVSSEPVFDLWKLSRIILQDRNLRELFTRQSSDTIIEKIRNPDAPASLAAFSNAFDEYLDNWGFRCSGELMLTVPGFQENPAGLVNILKTYMDVEGESPIEVLRRQKESREQLSGEALANISSNGNYGRMQKLGRKLLLKRFLNWTQGAIGMRERARLKQALLYNRLRHISLQIGIHLTESKLLEQADDIFFLTYQEVDELASSRAMFSKGTRSLIGLRRQEHERLGRMELPDSFIMEEGTYLNEKIYAKNAGNKYGASYGDLLEGTVACGGKIQGRAAVLNDVTEADQLNVGDILVTTQTDPGWGHVFFLIKGLIIERGGMLSHGAILAREFGIPAVVGVANATDRIPQYATVLLDADEGRVHVL